MPDRPDPAADSVVLVRVAEVLGSAPREAGAAMLVGPEDGEGTIGGGALEWRAQAIAREMLATGERFYRATLPLGPALGQCCGGQVTLAFTLTTREAARAALHEADGDLPLVALYGAGHVGRAVARILGELPCRLLWFDPRPGMFPAGLPARVRTRRLDTPEAAVAAVPGDAFHLVMTHSHPLDLALTEAVLRRGDFAWLGLIGSRTKRARFARRLRAAGIGEDLLARLVCPIGISGIRDKRPAVIAVAVAAQLLLAFEARAARHRLRQPEVAG